MSRKFLLALPLVGISLLFLVVALTCPKHTVIGLVRGESFYRSRSTTYWQNVIAADGAAGEISQATLDVFGNDPKAVPVLKACLAHSDPNVRWPSVLLLQRCALFHDQKTEFTKLLDDPDKQVRLQSIQALGRLRREALPALPRLSELARSTDIDFAVAARHSLWNIDVASARKAEKWAEFKSQQWGFSAEFPGDVETNSRKADLIDSDLHEFWAWSGVSRFTVVLSFVLPNAASTVAERYEKAPQMLADALNGKLERNDPIEQHGLAGREQRIVAERGILQARVFIVGNRVYLAQVVYKPDQLHPDAVKYFLDSFTVRWHPKDQRQEPKP